MAPFPLPRPARLAVFASGRGSNLAALLDAFPPGSEEATIELVVSNRADATALERARDAGVRAVHVPFGRTGGAFEREATVLLRAAGIDLVLLAGFMRVLGPDFVREHRGRLLNIHPSLLPSFPGLRAVEQALEAGASETGCSVHFVDAGVDTGPVILQRGLDVRPDDDATSLAARILELEHEAYPAAVRLVLQGVARAGATEAA